VTTTLPDAPARYNATDGLGPDELAALDIARDLVQLGVPVFTATLDRDGRPARIGWQAVKPDLAEIDNWRPGMALCAVMGHKFDALDIDPRHGGQESYDALLTELGQCKPTVYGTVQTPSGGEHFWLAPLGVGSRDGFRNGLDFKGGRLDGSGRGLVFIPPTVRPSKVTGELLPYRWTEIPSITPAQADRTGTPLARIVSDALNGNGTRRNGTALRAGIDLGAVVTGGVPEGEPHDQYLARYTMKLAGLGLSSEEAYPVWLAAVSNTKLTREGEPLTRADFERHWNGAVRKVEREDKPPADKPRTGRRIVLGCASDIEPEPVVWAWQDGDARRLPAGALCLGAGREGTGKSSFAIWMASQVTRGTLPGSFCGKPRPVIFVTVEDSWKHTMVPRLMAAGADLTKVYRAEVRIDESDDTMTLALPLDNFELEQAIETVGAALVVLDPLMSVIGASLDTHKNREVRQALDPIAAMADRTGAVFFGICHFNKGNSSDASSLITGSGAFKDVARAVLAFADDEDGGSRVMTQTKNSLGRLDLPSLDYQVESVTVGTRLGPADVARFAFKGQSERSVRDILRGRDDEGENLTKLDLAIEWLREYLDQQGPTEGGKVLRAAYNVPIAERTLERARSALGVITKPQGFQQPWRWHLPESLPSVTAKEPAIPSQSPLEPPVLADTGDSGPDQAKREPVLADSPQTSTVRQESGTRGTLVANGAKNGTTVTHSNGSGGFGGFSGFSGKAISQRAECEHRYSGSNPECIRCGRVPEMAGAR